ncbi:uncharacterized protein LOC144444562 isoform X2 [Glandiceps talaboti]
MSDQQVEEETTQQEEQENGEESQEKEKEEGEQKEEGENKDGETYEEKEAKRHRQYQKQLEKMKDTLTDEKSKIVKPESVAHTPYIWNSLAPYYKTDTVQYLMDMPNEVRHGYITRKTAVGMVDPEVSHRMDVELDPVPDSLPVSTPRDGSQKDKKQGGKKEGSTRLPKWPVVKMDNPDMANKEMDWSDVPKLREELRTKYSGNATERKKNDYTRTKQDWYRMELSELKKIHPVNRAHMKVTCTAYLGTSPGAKKAVSNLSKSLDE